MKIMKKLKKLKIEFFLMLNLNLKYNKTMKTPKVPFKTTIKFLLKKLIKIKIKIKSGKIINHHFYQIYIVLKKSIEVLNNNILKVIWKKNLKSKIKIKII